MFFKIIHKSEASCVIVRKELILNQLEAILALTICVQTFSVLEIIVECFKIE